LALSFNSMVHDIKASQEVIESQNTALKHEQSRLRASLESLNVGFIITDDNNKLLMINRSARDILSHEVDENGDVKKAPLDLKEGVSTIDDLNKRLSPAVDVQEKMTALGRYGMPVEIREVDYKDRILYVYLAPIMEYSAGSVPSQLGTAILISDITEDKVAERSKDEFFSIASHELRTPLTAIRGNTSLIQQYFADSLKDESLKDMIGDIHESSTRLIDIVNDFLDLSRLEQGKVNLKLEEFSLEPIIENIVYEMRIVLQEKKLYLKFDKMTLDSLPKVLADKDRTKQIIYNLVGNATKFTEKGGISISAKVQGDKIKVLVDDTGRGIPLQSQKLLFHKFQQATSSLLTRDTTRGTGLGLYISKMLVEKMSGKINLEHSVEGQGSTFSFTLPIATAERKQKALSQETTAQTDIKTGLTKTEAADSSGPVAK
jgi:signal transduction histidine kinase